jgi:general secretion pathway protein I
MRGFTLLEVLIALAIVAMSVGALLGTVTSSASNVIYLKEKTQAEWVALNRLTELRIDKDMPDMGKRTGSTVMGGMTWEWEEEVTELPIEGMFRVDVRAHSTGEFVDDSRPVEKTTAQTLTPSKSSGSSLDKTAWTTTVTGVIGTARSDLSLNFAAAKAGTQQQNNNPANPNGAPGNNPGSPNAPGTGGRTPAPQPPPRDR